YNAVLTIEISNYRNKQGDTNFAYFMLFGRSNNQNPNLCSDSKIHSKIVCNATQSHENRSKR
ncbi:MAG: hypothetical protein II453_16830, partial [Alphaproteobacteria bacterium]|nr:hypothetical protein [Alphaproteobacteria bacterium]